MKNSSIHNSKKESGATMVEYSLLIAFITIIALVSVKALSTQASGVLDKASQEILK